MRRIRCFFLCLRPLQSSKVEDGMIRMEMQCSVSNRPFAQSTGRVYCGNLPATVREADVRGLFDQFGAIRSVDIKASSGGPSFAFVEFESRDNADEAVRARKDHAFEGQTLRVEASRNSNDRDRDRERRPAQKRTDYRVIVSNLPPSGSWQDLKVCAPQSPRTCIDADDRLARTCSAPRAMSATPRPTATGPAPSNFSARTTCTAPSTS